jgi:hypothetical protein
MKKFKATFFLALLVIIPSLNSCKNSDSGDTLEGIDFGESTCYDSFLWVDAKTVTLTKELKFDFSKYAVNQRASIKLQFVNSDNKKLSDKEVSIYVDGKLKSDGIISVLAKEESLNKIIGIQFLLGTDKGKQNGFLTVVSHDFDRVDNFNSVNLGKDSRIKKWSAYHEKDYNPLALSLFWLVIFIVTSLFFWFLVLRNMIHPKFKRGKIQILSPYFGGISMDRSTRLVVFTNTIQKQKGLNRLFTGKIKYEVNPIYEKDVILRPGRRGKVRIKLPMGTRITPAVINLEKYNKYNIETSKQSIEIQYS